MWPKPKQLKLFNTFSNSRNLKAFHNIYTRLCCKTCCIPLAFISIIIFFFHIFPARSIDYTHTLFEFIHTYALTQIRLQRSHQLFLISFGTSFKISVGSIFLGSSTFSPSCLTALIRSKFITLFLACSLNRCPRTPHFSHRTYMHLHKLTRFIQHFHVVIRYPGTLV